MVSCSWQNSAQVVPCSWRATLSLDADRLGHALASADSGTRRLEDVGDALSVLKDEHIVINDGQSWHGLHELRSLTLTELLHESPPPTLALTWSRTAALLTPSQAGWMLRRVAERAPSELLAVAQAAAALIADPSTTAVQAAELLEGAERADNVVYARASKPILEAELPAYMSLHDLALLAYCARNQEQAGGHIGVSRWDHAFDRVKEIAARMPERSAATSVASAARVAAGVTDEVLGRLLATASSADAARLLEAAAGLIPISEDRIRQVLM